MWFPAKFWRWWTSELSALFPNWIGVAFLGATARQKLVFRKDINALNRENGSISAPLSMFEASPPVLAARKRPAIVDVHLPKDRCLARRIEAPAKAASKLHSMADLDLKRNTPFSDGDLLWELDEPKKSGDTIVATQWAARRSDVEHIKRQLKAIGVTVQSVRVEGIAGVLADYSSAISSRARYWRWMNVLLFLATIAAGGYLWLGPAWIAQKEIVSASVQLESLRSETLALRRDVDAMRTDRARLDDLQTSLLASPRLVEAMRELTVALPDQGWVSNMTFGPKAITIGGETSGSAVELLLALSKSNFFSNARQSGPTTRTGSGGERFEIAVTVGDTP